MNIPEKVARFLQEQLKKAGFDPGPIDGDLGTKTYKAAAAALTARTDAPAGWKAWPGQRQAVAFLQLLCKDKKFNAGEIDGYWGHLTSDAVDDLIALTETGAPPPLWRNDVHASPNPSPWPRQIETELNRFYGKPGTNQTKVSLPYPHRLAWEPTKIVNSFTCHEKVAGSIERALKQVLDHYGLEKIQALRLDYWGGCLNNRKMRGGSKTSMHAWGIAIDYDPERNQLKWGRDRAAFAKPDYDAWWRCWEEEGWVSLGRARNFDWMHVQAARL